MDVHQFLHTLGIVPPGPPLAHLDVPPAPQRLTHHQLVAHALALVLVVLLGRAAWQRRQSRPHLAEELLAGLVEADHRVQRVVRQHVGLDHVFHPPDVVGIDFRRDAPSLNDPGLNVVFLSACRTVSVETVRTRPNATSSSQSRLKVQWQRPSGGSLQASCISLCSTFPLILILSGRGGWGLWPSAAWNPSVTSRLRTRSTVRRLVPRAATMPSSPCPRSWEASASSRMRAWVSCRAAALPTETVCSNWARSSAVKVTRYFSIVALLFLGALFALILKKQDLDSPVNRRLTGY